MTLSIGGLLSESWAIFKREWRFLVPLTVVLALASIVLNGATVALEESGHPIIAAVINGIIALVGIAVGIGLANVFLIITAGAKASWFDVTALLLDWNLYVRFLVSSVLFGAMVFLGLVLLIVPGIYIALRFQYFGLALIDRNCSIKEAFAESTKRTYGVKWTLLGLFLVIALLNLAGLLPLGVGLLVTVPLGKIAITLAYRTLAGNPGPAALRPGIQA